jgi:hypothetical protein
MVKYLKLPYFSNLANDAFARHPLLAAPMLHAMWPTLDVTLDARYGKTAGAFQPSEASAIMTHWCGGGHPSAVVSARVLPGQEGHLARTIAATRALFDAPLVIKNAWHCFRIPSLATLLSNAHFIWVRRDITASAMSDLASRYVTRGDPEAWNSATPAGIDQLRRLPYWAQVVENQYEFTNAVGGAFKEHAADRQSVVWFEDLVRDPHSVLLRLAYDLRRVADVEVPPETPLGGREPSERPFRPGDEERLRTYVAEQGQRLAGCHYAR